MAWADDKVPPPVTPKTTPLPVIIENFGRFTMEISSSFWQKTGTGTDKQEEHGTVVVMLNKKPQTPGKPAVHELQGTGTLGFYESVNAPKCSFSASAKVDVQVTGQLRPWPTCDMTVHIIWNECTIYPLGTCHGFPLDPFKGSRHEYNMGTINLPLSEGMKEVFFHQGGVMSTVVFKDVRIDYHGLRCTEEIKE
jgi:hypothetical protein